MDTSLEMFLKICELIKNSCCMECGSIDSLLFCIVCGHVGCDVQHHALEHYKATHHKYVMDVQRFNVWDYEIKKVLHNFDAIHYKIDKLYKTNQANEEKNCSCSVCHRNRIPTLLKKPVCMNCEIIQVPNLWICLLCSYIGCGRNYNRHALQHYKRTKHPHVMQLNNFIIWDYKAKKYLHRQLHHHPVTITSEINEFGRVDKKEDFLKHMNLLECHANDIIKLIKRLVYLAEEKNLEEKLCDCNTKLNSLLTQFADHSERWNASNHIQADEIETMTSVVLKPTPIRFSQTVLITLTIFVLVIIILGYVV